MKKKVVIIGSTGSIGINALKVIERHKEKFDVIGLTACNNVKLIEKQIREFSPKYVAIKDKGIKALKKNIVGQKVRFLDLPDGLEHIVSLKEVDIVILAMSGSSALRPFLAAVKAGKRVAPANKEALVIAGSILMKAAKRHKAEIIPVDSEQSAIFQCLCAGSRDLLKKVYLTASGGSLLHVDGASFNRLTVEQILKHPRWRMGRKITVDSATLMNKGFEFIEAQRLFDLKMDEIEVVIHPEAIIHSMVEFLDGSTMAQMGVPDMRLPIQFALSYPQRWDSGIKGAHWTKLKSLTFLEPDYKKFPCLKLAMHVARMKGTLPSVLNAADEVAVEAFLNKKIDFKKIFKVVETVVMKHKTRKNPTLEEILSAEEWGLNLAREEILH